MKVHVMTRPPDKLQKEKLLEGVGGLCILDNVGVKLHKLKGLKLHAKLLLADNVRGIVRVDQPCSRKLLTAAGSVLSKCAMRM